MLWLWIIPVLFMMFAILLFSSIYVACHFTYTKEKQVLIIRVYLYHVRIFKRKIDLDEEESSMLDIWNGKNFLDGLQDLQNRVFEVIRNMQEMKTAASLLLERLKFHAFKWHTHVGTGEAGTAGLAAGSVWMIKGTITGIIANKSNLCCRPDTTVKPYFQYKCMQSRLDCMVSIKIGQAMGVFFQTSRKQNRSKATDIN